MEKIFQVCGSSGPPKNLTFFCQMFDPSKGWLDSLGFFNQRLLAGSSLKKSDSPLKNDPWKKYLKNSLCCQFFSKMLFL